MSDQSFFSIFTRTDIQTHQTHGLEENNTLLAQLSWCAGNSYVILIASCNYGNRRCKSQL